MKVARLLFGAFPARFAIAAFLGLAAGACGAGLVASVAKATASTPAAWIAWAFVLTALGRVLTSLLAQIVFLALSNRVLVELRLRLARNVLAAPVPTLEALGQGQLIGALTDDVQTVGAAAGTLVTMLTSAGTIVGIFLYLVLTAPLLALAMGALYAIGFFVFTRIQKRGQAVMMSSGPFRGRMFGSLTGSVAGVKELKLHDGRRREFLSALTDALHAFHGRVYASFSIFGWGESLQQASFFLVVAVVAFAAPYVIDVRDAELSGLILGALYLAMPTALLVEGLSQLAQTSMIVDDLSALGLSLAAATETKKKDDDHHTAKAKLERIDLLGIERRAADGFSLGPIDLKIRPGEILFLVGGNGSGKTTLAKILLGLYPADRGDIMWNGSRVSAENLDAYRSLFGGLFAEVHLFDRVYGASSSAVDEEGGRLLKELGLAHKVTIREGVFSTVDLSQGQRKRLALVSLLLDDRPIYVLDEWAAEQDPEFKRKFYQELLPALRARGKTVIAISHDDHYFNVADRIVSLEDGRLTPMPAESSIARGA